MPSAAPGCGPTGAGASGIVKRVMYASIVRSLHQPTPPTRGGKLHEMSWLPAATISGTADASGWISRCQESHFRSWPLA